MSSVDSESRPSKRSKLIIHDEVKLDIKPLGFSSYRPPPPFMAAPPEARRPGSRTESSKEGIAAIIAAAAAAQQALEDQRAAEAAAAAAKAQGETQAWEGVGEKRQAESKEEREQKRRDRKEKEKKRKEDREANKEKRLLKLVGAVVVKCMSKYRAQLSVDMFKKHAKEVSLFRLS